MLAEPIGSVQQHIPFWERICKPGSFVLEWLKNGFPLWWDTRGLPKPFFGRNGAGALANRAFVSDKVAELVGAGAAWPVPRDQLTVMSPFQVVPKKSGEKLRLILDMRHVNQQLLVRPFKFERLQDIAIIARPGDMLMTIDLTNGYWQLGMAPSSARFMGFEWEGQTYVFGVLPFGLASAPWAFTQFMKAFCSYLRSLGWRLINYLDDFTFPVSPKELQAAQEAGLILAEFREAGLGINVPKSMLQPSTQARSLGFLLDTVAGIFMVPQDRWDIFTTVVKRLLLQGGGSARLVAASAGHAISMKLV